MFKFAPSTPLTCAWDIQSLLPEAVEDTQVVWQSVKSHLMKAHRRATNAYNKDRQACHFKIGDLVWCKTHPLSSGANKLTAKMMPRWSGPFRIIDFLNPVTANLGHPETLAHVKKGHVGSLKPAVHENGSHAPDAAVSA